MADGVVVKLEGIDELKNALADVSKKIRTEAVRGALRKAGRIIQRQAKLNAPVMSVPTKTRKPGTVKNAISVRASKIERNAGNEGVFVSVRPLKSSKVRAFKVAQARAGKKASGSENPNDPYYWWWVEFGHKIVKTSGKSGYGMTTYQVKLNNGKVITKSRKYNKQSLTGRRRAANTNVAGKFFMTRAAESKGQAAISEFMAEVVPQIEKLNKKAEL